MQSLSRRIAGYAIPAMLLAIAIIHLYAPVFGIWAGLRLVSLVVFLIATLVIYEPWPRLAERYPRFFGAPAPRIVFDGLLVAAVAGIAVYIFRDFDGFFERTGYPTTADLVAGAIFLFAILEATRRSLGWPLVILCIVFVFYAIYGRSMPGPIAHAGTSLRTVIEFSFRDSSGVLGIPVGVMASYVVIFIFIGSMLERAGAGAFLLEISRRIVGSGPAGPAKIAVVSSALMGSISGSAVANVVTTGAFTIPLMKRIGIAPAKAGAIEAVASTGGLIMPPIMGAAAFIAAQNARMTYIDFAIAATIPALFYFLSLFIFVDLEGRKHGIRDDTPREKSATGLAMLREAAWILPPFVILVYMLVQGYSPGRCAGVALLVLAAAVMVRFGPRGGFRFVIEGLVEGARASAPLLVAAAAAGIVISMVYLSGLGLRFTSLIVTAAGENLLACLVLVALATLVLGMGLPITASYLTAATLAVPALKTLGVSDLAGHMFVFYFAAISAITPPVALASYAAAGVANAPFWSTSMQACKAGLIAFLVPFVFVYRPELLYWGASAGSIVYVTFTGMIGIFAMCCAAVGYLNSRLTVVERLVLAACALTLIVVPRFEFDIASVTVVVAVAALRLRRSPTHNRQQDQAGQKQ